MRYSPFDVDLQEISETHLAKLREVAEGWHVEYKSEVPKPKVIAKSLSSFANRHGGWLFFGILEDSTDSTAASYPGIPDAEVASAVQRIRDAAKDLLQPTVQFSHHTVKGAGVSLPPGRSIVVVRIPEGASTPYVHNDGRIYVRTGNSSSPVPANDRTSIDLLHRKAEEKRALLYDLIDRRPVVSKGEAEETTYLHLVLGSDPFQVLDHWYGGSFTDFSTAMRAEPMPFDNIYTSHEGFVARQALGNKRYNRLFTWEFSRRCNSFVTFPLPGLAIPYLGTDGLFNDPGEWSDYVHGERFIALLAERGLKSGRVLNLNIVLSLIDVIIARHCALAEGAGVEGPFYIKAMIENTWRTIPFVDTAEYISHIEAFDVPVVQDSDLIAPPGDWPEGFITVPKQIETSSDSPGPISGSAINIWARIMEALGLPGEVLTKGVYEIVDAAKREAERHRNRLTD